MFNIDPVRFLFTLAVVLPFLTIHEYAHAWMAYRFGDNTAKSMGRLTLNPIAHIDLFGTIILPLLVPFGYAKPVPVNFSILDRKQIFLVAFAGPLSNILVAIILTVAYHILPLQKIPYAEFFLSIGVLFNLIFAVFNLIPIPPLDGSRIVYASLKSPKAINAYRHFSRFGLFILIGFLVFGGFDLIVWPVVKLLFSLLGLPSPF